VQAACLFDGLVLHPFRLFFFQVLQRVAGVDYGENGIEAKLLLAMETAGKIRRPKINNKKYEH
jgi:hypothetical protein